MRSSDWSSDVCASDLSELQQAGSALVSPEVPESHGGRYEISSSGSTGRPVKAQGTQLAQFIWDALTLQIGERRVGTECVSPCLARWSPTHSKKQEEQPIHHYDTPISTKPKYSS